MKTLIHLTSCIILILGINIQASSQAPRSAYDTPSSPTGKSGTVGSGKKNTNTKTKATNAKKSGEAGDYNTNQPNLPLDVMEESGESGLYGVGKQSLRKDNILEDGTMDSTATPLDYTKIFASDAMYRVRVWRTIDARTPQNAKYFFNKAIEEEDNKRLINIMLRGIKEEGIQAFSNIDDRFTTPISFDDAVGGFGGGKDTSARYDLEGNIVGYQVRSRAISPDSIYKFRLKEEWLFNKRDGKTYVRILGIAPVISYTTSDGYTMDNSEHAVFWVYYPDIRKVLVRNSIINPLNLNGYVTWEQVFENRLFESNIVKSSLDAENGFSNSPLTGDQASVIQDQLNNLSARGWAK
ncbi:MAG TPA: gliding motility protein GldN [Niabella sp.]|nr:gliding motility protein GldN [Niabella sp.]HOZ98473.1 gliding motility protein GldN [Niabella sp.]HQW16001.1 gliding motility protein GldN [Niabella sp.]HQX21247.1 gliding motility protein GldN [Niabella sp.]HQX42071.1 gliding motility protein GldN [Niabella sp.]